MMLSWNAHLTFHIVLPLLILIIASSLYCTRFCPLLQFAHFLPPGHQSDVCPLSNICVFCFLLSVGHIVTCLLDILSTRAIWIRSDPCFTLDMGEGMKNLYAGFWRLFWGRSISPKDFEGLFHWNHHNRRFLKVFRTQSIEIMFFADLKKSYLGPNQNGQTLKCFTQHRCHWKCKYFVKTSL